MFLKKFAIIWLPASLLVVMAAFGYWQEQRQTVLAHYRTEAQHHVEGQAQLVRRTYRLVASNMHVLSHHLDLLRAIRREPGAEVALVHLLSAMMEMSDIYEQAWLLGPAGEAVVHIRWQQGQAHVVQEISSDAGLSRNEVEKGLQLPPDGIDIVSFGVAQRPARSVGMVMRLMVPVVNAAGHKQGLLVLDVRGEGLLSRALAETRLQGEHLLMHVAPPYWFDRRGGELQVQGGKDGDTLPQRFPLAWQRILKHHAGQFMDGDGLFSFESVRPSEFLGRRGSMLQDWNIVSFVPDAALSAAINAQRMRILTVAATTILLLGLLAWALAMSRVTRVEKERAVAALRARSLAEVRALSNRLVRVQEEERKEISRTLHDDIGQTVVAIRNAIASAMRHDEARDHARVLSEMQEASQLADSLMQTVRRYMRDLRPGYLEELGLKAALEEMCSAWEAREGTSCRLSMAGEVDALPEDVALNLFRLVQEGLANIARHARASKACVELVVGEGELELDIRDDGQGMVASHSSGGLGLVGMRERVQAMQGAMQMDSLPGEGVHICIRVPLPGRP